VTLALLLGLATFTVNLLLHALIWNLFKVRKEILALLVVFTVIPMAGYFGAGMMGIVPFWSLVAAGLLHFMLACAYIQTYPALREDIPSVAILFFIRDNPDLDRDEIIAQIAGRGHLLTQKVEDLCRDGLAEKFGDRLVLTCSGRILAGAFQAYRRLLGAQREQG
jgi:hypothetical protein